MDIGPERRGRRPVGRATFRRRQLAAALGAVLGIVLIWVVISPLFSSSTTLKGGHPSTTQATTTTTAAPATTTTTDPGLLPQTDVEPPTDGASLMARLGPLFSAIQTNSLSSGMSVFFPESAYLQMKTGILPNPSSDYASRLVAFYGMDLATYQHALGIGAATATLASVGVNPAYASWIAPGTCENSVGYWHLPNIRLVYSTAGTTQSFGVASLISWRGVWFVVHLGPNPRPSNIGTVDQPASGPGTPGPPGGC